MSRETTADSRRSGWVSKGKFRCGLRILLQAELLANLLNDLRRRGGDLHGYSVIRLLEIVKLTRENLFVREMSVPSTQALGDQGWTSRQINETDFRPYMQFFAVAAFQGRTGQHNILTSLDPLND